jgi:hypothetical protein
MANFCQVEFDPSSWRETFFQIKFVCSSWREASTLLLPHRGMRHDHGHKKATIHHPTRNEKKDQRSSQ